MLNFFKSKNSNTESYSVWLIIFQIGGGIAALDNAYVLSQPIYNEVLKTFESVIIAVIMTLTLVVAFLIVVDWALFKFLPTCLKGIFKGTDNKHIQRLNYGTLIFCLLTTGATIATTFYLREPAAQMAAEKPKLTNVAQVTAQAQASLDKNTASIDKDIEDLKAEKNEAIRKAGTGNKELNRLADSGNGWAIQKIRAAKNSVRDEFDKKIEKLQKSRSNTYSTESEKTAKTVAAIEKANDFEMSLFWSRTKAMSDFLMYFSLLATFFEWFAAVMMALYMAGFETYDDGKELVNTGLALQGNTGGVYTNKGNTQTSVYTPNTAQNNTKTGFVSNGRSTTTDRDGGHFERQKGYIFVQKRGKWYDPTQFINWIRNAYDRGQSNLTDLQADLKHYLNTESEPSQKILDFIKKYPEKAGVQANKSSNELDKLPFDLRRIALHESAHFAAYCAYIQCAGCMGADFLQTEAKIVVNKGGFNDKGAGGYFVGKDIKKHTPQMIDLFSIHILAGLAVEYTNLYNGTADSFFFDYVLKIKELKGSDTYSWFEFSKANNLEIGLQEAFFYAIDFVYEHLEFIEKVATQAALKYTLETTDLEVFYNEYWLNRK